jgi:hypothetical protein
MMTDSKTNICGARTREGACMSEPVTGKTRCRLHGGASTGAKTAAGRQRQSEAMQRRWAEIKAAMTHYRQSIKSEAQHVR